MVAHFLRNANKKSHACSTSGDVSADEQSRDAVHVGIVVSRAVGNAVVRNRVKRRLRHVLRQRLTHLPTGSSLVVRALPAAAEASGGRLTSDLDRILAKVTVDTVRRRGIVGDGVGQ